MIKFIISILACFMVLPAFAEYETVTATDKITWPYDVVINTIDVKSGFKDAEKSVFLGHLSSTNLKFSLIDFAQICVNSFNSLYGQEYTKNKVFYQKKCSDAAGFLVAEYNLKESENFAKPCIFKVSPSDLQNIENTARAKETEIINKGGTPAVADTIYKSNKFIALNSMIPTYCGNGVRGEIGIDQKTKQQIITCGNCLLKK